MIYGNLLSYSSSKLGKVWLFGRPTFAASSRRPGVLTPTFYIEGRPAYATVPTLYSSLSEPGNPQITPLALTPGDLLYFEITNTGGIDSALPVGGFSFIGGGYLTRETVLRLWYRYYGSTYIPARPYPTQGGYIEINTPDPALSTSGNKFFTTVGQLIVARGDLNNPSIGQFPLQPKTFYATTSYSYYATRTNAEYPKDCGGAALRKFVWQPSTAQVPADAISFTSATDRTYGYLNPTMPIKHYQKIGTSAPLTITQYESTYWNDTIVTGP